MSNASISATSSSTSHQFTLDGHLVDSTVTEGKSLKLTEAIVEQISKYCRSSNIVEDKGLSNIFLRRTLDNRSYDVLSRKTIFHKKNLAICFIISVKS